VTQRAAAALAQTEPVDDVPESFVAVLSQRFAERPHERFVVLLSGGSLAAACYERAASAASLDWSLVDLYMGDERMVPADDPDANQRLVRTHLVDRVGGVGSFTPMPTDRDPADCASDYDAVIDAVLAGPGIDVVHLGLGPDGHTASLFPGSADLGVVDRRVIPTRDPNGNNPHERLSVTYPVLDAARLALFTAAGDEKRDAVRRLRHGDDLPAGRVAAPEIRWLIDRQADDGAGPR
jgi:6-phosphogluconolactonase